MNKAIIRLTAAALVGVLAYEASSLALLPRIAISAVVGIPAFVLMIVSRRQLGQSFTLMPAAKALVTTGVYSRIQHPMYVFLDLFLAALILALDMPILLWIWGVLIVIQTLQSRREESVLRASFGAEYDGYAKQAWF